MLAFLRGEADVLVATSIIESGIDIPQANTLIVERADIFGLAQLYQIRGRVGRSRERAYAYLLYPSAEALTHEAGQRLAALSDYTELGAGFKVAMRDLEIRGAGNLLGDEQSGHVAALGFELYLSMIDEAVAAAEGLSEDTPEPVRLDVNVDAYVPADYVPYEQAKIDVHRRIAGAVEVADLALLREELEDRFGPIPEPLSNLIDLQQARIKLGQAGARAVTFRQGRLAVTPIELDSVRAKAIREQIPGRAVRVRQVSAVDARARRPPAALPRGGARGRRAAGGFARGCVSFLTGLHLGFIWRSPAWVPCALLPLPSRALCAEPSDCCCPSSCWAPWRSPSPPAAGMTTAAVAPMRRCPATPSRRSARCRSPRPTSSTG